MTEGKVDALLSNLASVSWKPGLTRESYASILRCGFRGDNSVLAAIIAEIAVNEHPLTLRGLFYQVVSCGFFPSTDQKYYTRTGRITSRLRKLKIIDYRWIVDNMRSTEKPSSWSGLADFTETVRDAYRKDFWNHLPEYVHVFCEKDAIAGTIAPVTREYDVALSPVRGYVSDSFAFEIGHRWQRIEKPIYAYYLGDYDPSGMDIERDLKSKLLHHAERADIHWERLAINQNDFDDFSLIKLQPKKKDKRFASFVKHHGSHCAEVDALPATELRKRVSDAINAHIPADEWERLKNIEDLERETFSRALGGVA